MPRLMQVVVSDGNSCRLEQRPLVHVVRESYIKTDTDGSKETVVLARPVPLLWRGEVEFLSVTGESTIIRMGA